MDMRKLSGLTLIELMFVVIIIGILAAMVVPNLAGRGEQARITATKADIEVNLTTALDLYELDNGRYPSTEQGLRALVQEPTSSPVPRYGPRYVSGFTTLCAHSGSPCPPGPSHLYGLSSTSVCVLP